MVIVAALAPFADIIFALLMVVLGVLIAAVIVPPLVGLLRAIPLLGGQLADAVQSWANGLQRDARQRLDQSVQVVTDAIDLISGRIQAWVQEVTDFLDFAAEFLGGLPGAVQLLAKDVMDTIGGIRTRIAALVDDIARALTRAAAVAASLASALATTIPHLIAQAQAAVRSWVDGRVSDLRKAILALIATAEAGLLDALGQERLARKAADATMAGRIEAGLLDLERGIEGDIGRLADGIGKAIDGIETDLGNLTKLIGVVESGTIIGIITGIITEIETLRRECIDPMCSYLTPRLDVLNGLADAAAFSALAGIFAEAAHDPQGAARTVDGLVDGIIGAVRPAFRDLTGVAV